jgi:hypothetical protein
MNSALNRFNDVMKAKPRIAVTKTKLGFKIMDYLERDIPNNELKGLMFHAARKESDELTFIVKVNPLDLRYDIDSHPSNQESFILLQLQNDLRKRMTPHIARAFCVDRLPNNCKAMTFVPLKQVHSMIYRHSNIIVAEFVKAGSITDYLNNSNDLSLSQWRYIIFSIIWTLAVLQDKYQFVHADLHSSNVLIDISPSESPFVYRWIDKYGKTMQFKANTNIVPKLWDFEFATFFKPPKSCRVPIEAPNPFGLGQSCIPQAFDPYYDIHEFLMSVKELDCPLEVREFIFSLYPKELIANTPSCHSVQDNDYGEEDEEYIEEDECFYETDEDLSELDNMYVFEDEEEIKDDDLISNASSQPRSSQRTEYIIEGRLRNDIVSTHFSNDDIPTPFDLLSHPFFEEYRVDENLTEPAFSYRVKRAKKQNASG